MARTDWTPAVLVTATVSLTVVAMVWLAPYLFGPRDERPGPARDFPDAPRTVDLWVGEAAPGLKVALATVYRDPGQDRFHDDELNRDLSLFPSGGLAYYQLLLFNSSTEAWTVELRDGAISIRPAGAKEAVPLRSLSALVAQGGATVSPALRTVLQGLGTLRDRVRVEAGSSAILVVPFDSRVDLASAEGVTLADGTAFRRRRIGWGDLQRLIATPDEEQVKDL